MVVAAGCWILGPRPGPKPRMARVRPPDEDTRPDRSGPVWSWASPATLDMFLWIDTNHR